MKSRMTDGETRARPAVAVCCVAIVVALPSRCARQSPVRVADAFFLIPQLLPFPLLANEKGAGREDTPSCRLARSTRREVAGKRLSSLDVAALLHCGFRAGLSLGERLV